MSRAATEVEALAVSFRLSCPGERVELRSNFVGDEAR